MLADHSCSFYSSFIDTNFPEEVVLVDEEHTGNGSASRETVDLEAILERTPGYQFQLPDQCKAMFGPDFYPALTKFVSILSTCLSHLPVYFYEQILM